MRIGIPREVKTLEGRVGLIPAAAAELVHAGHSVFIEQGAGVASGYADQAYVDAGVTLLPDAATLYGAVQMVVKVKEPQPQEWPLLRADHLLFCYLHLPAEPALTAALIDIGLTAVAFETVSVNGALPLLAPMSDIAGRIAAQAGAQLLTRPQGGKGLLLGGLPAVERGRVVVLGAGVAGSSAAAMAAMMGAEVVVFDRNRDKLANIHQLGPNLTGLHAYRDLIAEQVARADLLIGAVLIPGAAAPRLVDRRMVKSMTPGSVIIDISVDQGGCIETTQPTTWAEATFVEEGVVHFGVTNMPGSVPRSASQALSAAITPFALRLAQADWEQEPALLQGVNVRAGEVVLPALRD